MESVKSCGVVVFRREPETSFLLLKLSHRYDLPKGHVEAGETEIECAVRELFEETGISREMLDLDDTFRYETSYQVRYRRLGGRPVTKTLVLFLGFVKGDPEIRVTEHVGHAWMPWRPPHRVQALTIDPLLEALAVHFGEESP